MVVERRVKIGVRKRRAVDGVDVEGRTGGYGRGHVLSVCGGNELKRSNEQEEDAEPSKRRDKIGMRRYSFMCWNGHT